MTRIARSIALILFITAALAAAAACSKKADPQPQEVGRPPVAVSVEPAVRADLQESVDVVGTLEAKFAADVKSEVTGVVTEVYVTEWVPVHRGEQLARLDTRETEAGIEALKAAEAQAKVGENHARREYERAQQLKQFGLITPQALDDAKTAVEAAETRHRRGAGADPARPRRGWPSRSSPRRWTASWRCAASASATASRTWAATRRCSGSSTTACSTSPCRCRRRASRRVRVGQTLAVLDRDRCPGRSFTGKVMFINPAIDPASRSAKVDRRGRRTPTAR